jgi:hypothetical protein
MVFMIEERGWNLHAWEGVGEDDFWFLTAKR